MSKTQAKNPSKAQEIGKSTVALKTPKPPSALGIINFHPMDPVIKKAEKTAKRSFLRVGLKILQWRLDDIEYVSELGK